MEKQTRKKNLISKIGEISYFYSRTSLLYLKVRVHTHLAK